MTEANREPSPGRFAARLARWQERLNAAPGKAVRFGRLLVRRFVEDQGLPNAASLTYTTLLSLVPLMTVSLAIFSAFPVSDRLAERVQDFVFQNFVPASGQVLQEHLQQFSIKASKLTGAGAAFLIVTAVMLMANIDHAINRIWRVSRKRSPLGMFMEYWSILTLGLILIGVSVAATSYLISMPVFTRAAETMDEMGRVRLLSLVPVLVSTLAFTLLYAVVPNRRVPFLHALAGGFLAAVLFELAKRAFAYYITTFPAYQAIYGALAAVPIFLAWVYLCWLITLLGAEFSACLGIFRDEQCRGMVPERNDLLLAYRLLGGLWQAQREGGTRTTHELSRQLGNVPEEWVELLLNELSRQHMVLRTVEGRWALARDLTMVTLYDLYRCRPFVLPEGRQLQPGPGLATKTVGEVLGKVEGDLRERLGVSLEQLYSAEERGREPKADKPKTTP
jgi:membrane protein